MSHIVIWGTCIYFLEEKTRRRVCYLNLSSKYFDIFIYVMALSRHQCIMYSKMEISMKMIASTRRKQSTTFDVTWTGAYERHKI